MKKSLLFFAALSMASTASFAQQKVSAVNMLKNAKKIEASSPKAALTTSSVVRKANGGAASTVYYQRPEGSFYLGFTNDFGGYSLTALALPAWTETSFVNASPSPASTKWQVNGKDAEGDANNNYLWESGPTSLSDGLGYYYMPTLTDGTNTFSLAQENADNTTGAIISPDTLYDFTIADFNTAFYYGGSGPTAYFGDRSLTYDSKAYNQAAFYQVYQAPIGGLYINEIHLPAWNKTSGATALLADGDELTADIYLITDGNMAEEPIATFKATKETIGYDGTSSTTGRMGMLSFYNKQDDGFGGELDAPAIIEQGQEFAVVVSGFQGKGLGFYFSETPEYTLISGDGSTTPYVFDSTIPEGTRFVCVADDNSTVDLSYRYPCYVGIIFNGYQDQVRVREDYTDSDTGATYNLDVLTAPVEGGVAKSEGASYAVVFSALPLFDADDNDNYDIDIDYQGEDDWLETAADISDFKEYGSNLIEFTADPLPAGKEGRKAIVTLKGKGVTSNPITITQGTVTGISSATATTGKAASNAIYNLAGQQVNRTFKGVVVNKGKKFVQK